MKTASDILSSMRDRGVKLWTDSGQLLYLAPQGVLTPLDIATLRETKSTIIEFLLRTQCARVTDSSPLVPRLGTEQVPLTYTQHSRWNSFQIIGMNRNTRTCSTALRLSGKLNVERLRMCMDHVVQRHESLRTRIAVIDSVPTQVIERAGENTLDVVDLTGITDNRAEMEAQRLVEEVINEPIDMSAGPLFKAQLLKLANHDHVLVLAIDHIVADGTSLRLLLRDLELMYTQAERRNPISLPPMPIQYADFAVWQQKTHRSWWSQHGTYWEEHFRCASRTRLPVVQQSAPVEGPRWASVPVRFERSIMMALNELARRNGTTIVMTVLTAYVALLFRWCRQKDVVVGFVTTGRHRPEVMNTIGFFASTLYLRIPIQEQDSLLDLLRQVTTEYCSAIEHQDWGLATVPIPGPDFARSASFNWQSGPRMSGPDGDKPINKPVNNSDAGRPRPFPFVRAAPEMEWDGELPIYGGEPWLMLSGSADGMTGFIRYRPFHFTSDAMHRFGVNFVLSASTFITAPETSLATVPYDAEIRQ